MVGSAKYITVIINMGFTILMARLLTPEDYGIFAVVNVIAGYIMTVSNLGIGSAIIQKKDLSDDDISNIYVFSFGIGILLSTLMSALGFACALIYKESVYIILCFLLAISVFFYVINIVPNALLLRNGEYGKVAKRNIIVAVASMVVAICVAIAGGKYYALIFQNIILMVTYYIWNIRYSNIKFNINYKGIKKSIQKIFSYALYSFGGDTVSYFELSGPNMLIGPFLGSIFLGLYDKAYRLIDYPVGNLAGVLNTILHPLLKDYQDEPTVIIKKYEKIEKIFSIVAVYISTIFLVCAYEIIVILFGNKWVDAVEVFRYMSIAIYPKMLLATVNSVFSSLGNTKKLFVCQVRRAIVILICTGLGIMFGKISYIALFVSVGYWINLVVTIITLYKFVPLVSVKSIVCRLKYDIIYMFLTFIIYFILKPLDIVDNIYVSLLVKGLILSVVYLTYTFFSKNILEIKGILKSKAES